MWPSLVARFKASSDEADRIQSEVGIRFCRPQVLCWCGALPPTFSPTEPCTASSMLPALREWKAKGGGDPSYPSLALEKQDSIRARAGLPSKVASASAARGPGQRHASPGIIMRRQPAIVQEQRQAAGSSSFRPLPAFWGVTDPYSPGTTQALVEVLVREKSDRLPRLQSNETSTGKNTSLSSLTDSFRSYKVMFNATRYLVL